MMENENKRGIYTVLILIILVCNCVMLLVFSGKSELHIDEVFSHSLSNSHEKPFLFYGVIGTGEIGSEVRDYKLKEGEIDPFFSDEKNVFYEQWHSGEEFHDYMTVQENERFDYANVYYNQTCDIHPPLYYLFLHTVCSFFPDNFSIWCAAAVNLAFYSLSLVSLFFLGRQILKSDKKALLTTAVWGLSRAGLSNASFFRMYMMMTLFVILLAYFHTRLIKEYKIRYVIGIFAVNIAGFLTQYYFYVFSFFLTASVCFYLLFKKRIKQLVAYASAVLVSVGAALLIFPATIVHVTHGAYTDNAVYGLTDLFHKKSYLFAHILQDYTGIAYYGRELVADLIAASAILAVLVWWLRFCKKQTNKKEKIRFAIGKIDAGYAILTVSAAISGIVINKTAPNMGHFEDRYIFALLPLFALPFVSIVCFAADKAAAWLKQEKHGFKAAAAVLILFVVLSNTLNENKYFGRTRNTPQVNKIITEAADDGIFYFVPKTSKEYRIHNLTTLFINADKVYAAHEFDEALAERINNNEINADRAYILFGAGNIIREDGKAAADERITYLVTQNTVKRDLEFVTEFYFGAEAELYYLYKIDY